MYEQGYFLGRSGTHFYFASEDSISWQDGSLILDARPTDCSILIKPKVKSGRYLTLPFSMVMPWRADHGKAW